MAIKRTTKKKATPGRGVGRAGKHQVAELDLGKVLTIADMEAWQKKLIGIFDLREPVSIKGGDIEKIDSAGLQLLLAIMKEADRAGVEIKWSSASESLRRNAEQLGLGTELRLDAS